MYIHRMINEYNNDDKSLLEVSYGDRLWSKKHKCFVAVIKITDGRLLYLCQGTKDGINFEDWHILTELSKTPNE